MGPEGGKHVAVGRHNATVACESEESSYAQGGAYGFSQSALRALVGSSGSGSGGAGAGASCLSSVAQAVGEHRNGRFVNLFEDEAVGLCMRLHRVRLITCGCFYDWGPCNIFDPHASCAADTNASKICHLPLTVHKQRKLEWYDAWWKYLAPREPAALAALDAHLAGRA